MSDDWTDAELEIAVRQYWKAHKQRGYERAVDRAAFVRGALNSGLKSRGEGSVQRRMGNISAVMEANGKLPVIGWKSQPNVGSGVTPRIEALLKKYDLL